MDSVYSGGLILKWLNHPAAKSSHKRHDNGSSPGRVPDRTNLPSPPARTNLQSPLASCSRCGHPSSSPLARRARDSHLELPPASNPRLVAALSLSVGADVDATITPKLTDFSLPLSPRDLTDFAGSLAPTRLPGYIVVIDGDKLKD
ncbi:hypothetical protein ACMD2_07886 [Ananas comosus]|uniref:Uncharacterized protein n=1 Tax=Ananas comosus TaxID=4615 RepID=A0A199UIT3_ANACO|nr:hypothetical protein ACMD2_07886 [Ananas comosus]